MLKTGIGIHSKLIHSVVATAANGGGMHPFGLAAWRGEGPRATG
jgi:hypothetical protein